MRRTAGPPVSSALAARSAMAALALNMTWPLTIAWELGRACGSTAWCYALWTVHNWWVGHFPEAAQEEFFAAGPDVLASSALNPTRGTAEPVPGGYRVSGHWGFSSGCDAASWVMVAGAASQRVHLGPVTTPGLRHPRHVVHLWHARDRQQGHRHSRCLCPGVSYRRPEPCRRWRSWAQLRGCTDGLYATSG